MINLLKLEFENIGRFVEKQTINFTDKPKLIQLDGWNQNTGGSSGAGKSTVFHALDLLLGLNDLPASSLQSRLTKEGFWVSGTFLFNNQEVTITRSKKEGLVVQVGGEITEGSAKIGEEKIDALIGMPRNIFKKMIHKQQKDGGFFLNLSAKESYKFLIDCLQLTKWEDKIDKIAQEVKDVEVKRSETEIRLEQEKLQKQRLLESLESISKPEDIDLGAMKVEVSALTEQISALTEKINQQRHLSDQEDKEIYQAYLNSIPQKPEFKDLTSHFNEEMTSLNKAEQEALSLLLLKVKENNEKITVINRKTIAIEGNAQILTKILKNRLELESQKTHLLNAQCPTCSQKWVGEELQKKIQQVGLDIEFSYQEEIRLNNELGSIPRLKEISERLHADNLFKEEEIGKIKGEFSYKKAEIHAKIADINKEKRNIYQEYLNQTKSLELNCSEKRFVNQEKHLKLSENDRKSIEDLKNRLNSIKQTIETHTIAQENYEKLTKSTNASIKTLQNSIKDKEKLLTESYKQLLIATEAKRAIKTYTMQIFQDSLNFVGSYTTKLLNSIPAMANATLYFENCKETKTGKIKDEINCIINIDGENDINIKTLSGGERTAVDLAVDFAIVEMLESQLGIGADWMVLDEPFEGMDVMGIEAIIEVIKQAGVNKRIILVDHHSETKEIVDHTISVVRSGLESSIVCGI